MNATSRHFPEPGDRIQITDLMPNDPAPIPVGTTGTVVKVNAQSGQIMVDWDIQRSLILLDSDPFIVL